MLYKLIASCFFSLASLSVYDLPCLARGFQMLAAMGYEHGQGLGKGQSGRSVPLSVEIKGGRHGLGIAENKKRKQQQVEQQQKERGKLH